MSLQRYISKELSHFVGRGLDEESQYQLLIEILQSGWLTYPPHNPQINMRQVFIDEYKKLSKNEMYRPSMICFCDIPVGDLKLHIRKYSPFGIAFSKDFIIDHGGAPVFYLPLSTQARKIKRLSGERMNELLASALAKGNVSIEPEDEDWEIKNIGDYFDEMTKMYQELLDLINALMNKNPDNQEPANNLERIYNLTDFRVFLDFYFWSYLKFFDHSLPEDHPDNYYFEREWRMLDNLNFTIGDVKRVFIPEKYAEKFRRDFPECSGQLTFVE